MTIKAMLTVERVSSEASVLFDGSRAVVDAKPVRDSFWRTTGSCAAGILSRDRNHYFVFHTIRCRCVWSHVTSCAQGGESRRDKVANLLDYGETLVVPRTVMNNALLFTNSGSVRRASRHLVSSNHLHRNGGGPPAAEQRPSDARHLHDTLEAQPDFIGTGEVVLGEFDSPLDGRHPFTAAILAIHPLDCGSEQHGCAVHRRANVV